LDGRTGYALSREQFLDKDWRAYRPMWRIRVNALRMLVDRGDADENGAPIRDNEYARVH
jgi:hypothetical protein